MYIVSFDIGSKHLAYCIEWVNSDEKEGQPRNRLQELQLLDIRAPTAEQSIRYLCECLDKESLLPQLDLVLIEQQMRTNPGACAIQHYIYMYFIMRTQAKIVYVPSRWKTTYGMKHIPKKMTYRERKKWAVNEATMYLTEREEPQRFLDKLKEKKADDYADCLLQARAYCVKMGLMSSGITSTSQSEHT